VRLNQGGTKKGIIEDHKKKKRLEHGSGPKVGDEECRSGPQKKTCPESSSQVVKRVELKWDAVETTPGIE